MFYSSERKSFFKAVICMLIILLIYHGKMHAMTSCMERSKVVYIFVLCETLHVYFQGAVSIWTVIECNGKYEMVKVRIVIIPATLVLNRELMTQHNSERTLIFTMAVESLMEYKLQ